MARALASAFVRLKPDVSTFKSDADRGIGNAASELGSKHGKAFGAAFAKVAAIGIAGSGLLAVAGPLGAAGIALGAFGAVAVPILKKVETAHTALTAAQLAYNKATTNAGRATALKAEQQATAGLTSQQKGLMGSVDGVEKSFGKLENQLTPVVVTVASMAVKLAGSLMPVLTKLAPVGAKIIDDFLGPFTKLLNSPLGTKFFASVATFGAQLGALAGPQLVKLLGIFMQLFIQIMPSGMKILKQLLPAFVQMVAELVPIAVVGARVIAVMLKWLSANGLLVPALWLLVGAFVAMKLALLSNPIFLIGAAIATLAILVVKYHKQIWSFITRIWGDIFGFLKQKWNDILAFAKAWWPLLLGVGGVIYKYHEQIWAFIQQIWGKIVSFFGSLGGKIIRAFSGAGQWLYNAGKSVIQGLWNGLTFIWHKVTAFISSIAGWIKSHKGPLSLDARLLEPAGRALMSGLHIGLVGGFTKVGDFISGAAGKIGGFFSGLFGGGGSGVERWRGVVDTALGLLGEPLSLANQVLYQIGTESGGNPNAINLTDINAQMGDPSRGLLQTIGATFKAYGAPFLSGNIYDPLANVFAAINYAIHVYGRNLMSNGSGLGSGHGYALGGLITEPIVGVGASGQSYSFGEKGTETVIPGDVGSALSRIASLLAEHSSLLAQLIGHTAAAPAATGAATAGALNGAARAGAYQAYYGVT